MKDELLQTEAEHKQNMQAKKEREMLKEQKSRDIQEKKFVKKKVLPPTQDELLLFGDVIKQVNMQSEIDE